MAGRISHDIDLNFDDKSLFFVIYLEVSFMLEPVCQFGESHKEILLKKNLTSNNDLITLL